MPFTFGAFALASLSMIGAPPVGGFITKWYLLLGALDAGSLGILLVLVASTLLNAAYFVPVIYRAFFGRAPGNPRPLSFREAHPAMVIPLSLTAILSVVVGLFPEFFMRFAQAVLP
jgi:multicomponent Na+:H+ antiporter subunit D